MRSLLGSDRFTVCVDGDEDFVETYGPEDEGTEWRRRASVLEADACASEWTAPSNVRPRAPRLAADFLDAQPPPTVVQVCQDGGWWRAALLGRADDPPMPSTSEPPETSETTAAAPAPPAPGADAAELAPSSTTPECKPTAASAAAPLSAAPPRRTQTHTARV